MNVSSAGHPHHYTHAAGHRGSSKPASNPPVAVEAADDPKVSGETRATSSHHDVLKGVVGLLQSGHFKGVAAVRLGINFHEQLSGLDRESARTRVEAAAASLDEQMAGALEAYPEDASEAQVQLASEAQETFSLAIRAAVEGFRSGDSGQDDALAGMQTAFDDMLTVLEASFATTDPATEDSAADDTADALIAATNEAGGGGQATTGDVVEDAVAGTDEYLATLGQVFNSFLEGLQSGMDAINAIPKFTPPKGNGAAFDKFIAMYREIVGITSPVDTGTQLAAGIDQQS
jgi:hypothetical protein